MKNIVFFFALALIISCNSESKPTAGTGDLSGFELEAIDSGGKHAIKRDDSGNITEEGFLLNGNKNGVWITYHSDNQRIKTVANYSENQLNGPFLQFNNRGQIESKAGYRNGQYHGLYGKYKFGRAEEEIEYKNGQIDGALRKYFGNGKLQQEAEYKNGKQHGKFRYFDEEGNVTLEYTYEHGEKLEGGIK